MKTDKLERIRKRHANIVGYRKAVLRGRQGNRAARVQRNLALQRPGATGLRRYQRRLYQTSGTGYRRPDQRPIGAVCGEPAESIARPPELTPEEKEQFRLLWERMTRFPTGQRVYVSRWGYGTVVCHWRDFVVVDGDGMNGQLGFPEARCKVVVGDTGMDYPTFRQWQIENRIIKTPMMIMTQMG